MASNTTRDHKVHIGEALKTAMLATGISQKELADGIGIARSTLTNWFKTPNLSKNKVDRAHQAWKHKIDFRRAYDALTRKLGPQPDNPYVIKQETGHQFTDHAEVTATFQIQIPVRSRDGRVRVLPPDIEQRVAQMIDDYSDRYRDGRIYDVDDSTDGSKLKIASDPDSTSDFGSTKK